MEFEKEFVMPLRSEILELEKKLNNAPIHSPEFESLKQEFDQLNRKVKVLYDLIKLVMNLLLLP